MKRTNLCLLTIVATLLSTAPRLEADIPAWTAANPGVAGPDLAFSLGYRFTVTETLQVTHLGRVDYNGGGLSTPALAQLYQWDTGEPLGSVTIPAGMAGRETNGALAVHYAALANAITLLPNTNYLVAVEVTGGDFAYDIDVTMADAVQWVEGRATPVGSPAMPATANAVSFPIARPGLECYMGPSFKFLTASTNPVTLALSLPKARQIVQRNESNQADIRLQGTWSGAAARLEARTAVMPGTTNNGVATDWRVVVDAPTNGPYSGILSGVKAGGWYRVEVRALDPEGNVLASAAVERVGVGDVFVTAGQSNASCYGSPTQNPTDDRVSAYTLSSGTWRFATDPQPDISGGMGSGGSPWPILGSLLAQSNQVPIGFVGLAYGGTTVAQWAPGTALFRNLTNTLVRFGINGVRAVLWHQGESDSLESTSATTYAQRLSNVVARVRSAAGWSMPWGIAEASFHPSATRAQEEPVAAGQRLFTSVTPGCFRGPRTDDFNLEGKLSDTVHFNATGLAEHARRWANALGGVNDLSPKNGDFEANPAVADGVTITASRVIGWNRLNAAGMGIAAGGNGYWNPDNRTYPGSTDTVNGGVLPNMNGRHLGTLSSGATNNSFLQTLNATLQPSTRYTVTVALGVRTNSAVFGGYRLDLLANGVPLGIGATGDLASLDALGGGSASGAFTIVSYSLTSAPAVLPNQPLAIRITKPGGSGTYLDFDNVQVTSQLTPYGQWQKLHWGNLTDPESLPEADPDADGLPNLIESQLDGLNPRIRNAIPQPVPVQLGSEAYLEMRLARNAGLPSGGLGLRMSYNLIHWFEPSSAPDGDVIVHDDAGALTVQLRSGAIPAAFLRILARP